MNSSVRRRRRAVAWASVAAAVLACGCDGGGGGGDHALSTEVAGSGSVSRDPSRSSYPEGSDVLLTATPDAGWSFAGWSGDVRDKVNPRNVVMDRPMAVTATFTQDRYVLSVSADGGGSVTASPEQATYPYDMDLSLAAIPDAGWSFAGWSGDITGAASPVTITMDASKTVTAAFTQDDYTLAVTVAGNGSVVPSPDRTTYTYGEEVGLTAMPDAGWSFADWSGGLTGTENPDKIAIDGNMTVTATFTVDAYTLTATVTGDGVPGTGGSVVKAPDQATYTYGAVVDLTASPAASWGFVGWSGDITGGGASRSITVDSDKTVNAAFTQASYPLTVNVIGDGVPGAGGGVLKTPDLADYVYGTDVGLTATPADATWAFVGWSGDLVGASASETVTMNAAKTVTATFTQNRYALMVGTMGDGAIALNPNQLDYLHGTEVELTATPGPGSSFVAWVIDLVGTANPATITMDANKVVIAEFALDCTLTVNVVGGGAVGRIPDQVAYTQGTTVELTAFPDSGSGFLGWSGDLGGAANPETISMDVNRTVTATFTQNRYPLTVNVTGDGIVDRVPDEADYVHGSAVELTATPVVGWSFTGWSGALSGTTNPATVVMDAAKTVGATFTQDQYSLRINVFGSGSVAKDPDQATYTYGTQVALDAVPAAGWMFTSWDGDVTGTDASNTITMNGDRAVIATFYPEQYALTTNVTGSGSVGKNPSQPTYPNGQVVELTAFPASGWAFVDWSGGLAGTANPQMIAMDSDKAVTANFTDAQYGLTLDVVGNGSVARSPDQAAYLWGTQVQITATAGDGWSFVNWGGALGGSANPATITMDGTKTVTAHFAEDTYDLTVSVVGDGTVTRDPNQASYTYGTLVQLTAAPDPDWLFAGWSGDLVGGTLTKTIIMNGDKAVTATFDPDLVGLEVRPSRASIRNIGETQQFTAWFIYADGAEEQTGASWWSDDTLVATMDTNGLATATGEGGATITGEVGSFSDTAALSVGGDSTLVLWWQLNETNGNIAHDSSLYGNDGTLINMSAAAWQGDALVFDGTNDHVLSQANVGISGAQPRTMSFWVSAADPAAFCDVIGWGSSRVFTMLQVPFITGWYFYTMEGGDIAGAAIPAGVWQHHVVTYDGSNTRWYINGALSMSMASTLSTDDTPLRLGGGQFFGFFPGSLDEVRVYSRTLTQPEVQDLYNAGRTPPVPGRDLVIDSITHSPPVPDPGNAVTFTVTVKNAGALDAGPFNVGFWSDRASAPSVGTAPEQAGNVAGLAAGASTTLDFNVTAPVDGAYRAWAYADRSGGTGQIEETDETNNAGPAGGHLWLVGSAVPEPDVLWWKLNETVGTTANDDSVSGNDGALNMPATAWGGGALTFDGVDDFVESANPVGISGAQQRTMTFWALASNTSNGGLVGWGTQQLDWKFHACIINNDWTFYGHNSFADWYTNVLVVTGVWQHHALTYDGTTLVWYIDGAVIGTHIYAYNTDDTVLWAGKSEGVLSGYFAGSLDDVRVYSWALSQPEVQLVHAAGRY